MKGVAEKSARSLPTKRTEAEQADQAISLNQFIHVVGDGAHTSHVRAAENSGGQVGWKVVQRATNADAVYSPIFRKNVYESGARIATGAFKCWRPETSIGFRLSRDLPKCKQGHSVPEIGHALKSMFLCFDISNSQCEDCAGVAPPQRIANLTSHGATVVGTEVPFNHEHDFRNARVSLTVGDVETEVDACITAGEILEFLCWLANTRGLSTDEIVTIGLCMEATALAPGETATANLRGVGSVSVRRNAGAAWSD